MNNIQREKNRGINASQFSQLKLMQFNAVEHDYRSLNSDRSKLLSLHYTKDKNGPHPKPYV